MTDNEIIKAFENCFIKMDAAYCKICPYYKGMCNDSQLAKDTLDLINRQKAEIERLTDKAERATNAYFIKVEQRKNAKAEAIKEFAERLRYALIINNEHNTIVFDYDFTLETIDNLVKEMVGDAE